MKRSDLVAERKAVVARLVNFALDAELQPRKSLGDDVERNPVAKWPLRLEIVVPKAGKSGVDDVRSTRLERFEREAELA